MHKIFLFITILISINLSGQTPPQLTPYDYVNPLIGTQRMGHVFPGATVPFGMVQLSPDTDTLQYAVDGKYNKDVYKYCSGYQYDDKTLSLIHI